MRRAFRSAWIIAGLAVLGAMSVVGPGQARGGTIGITITGGFKPVSPDPPYDFIFNVDLDPGFEVEQLNLFTISGLKGVTSGSFTHQPPPNLPSYGWTPAPGTEQASWTFVGTVPITNPNPVGSNIEVPLGQFSVETTEDFPNGPPVPPGTVIPYTFTVTDLATGDPVNGSGLIVLQSIPEPSSIVLLALGAAALPAIVVRRKRRRIARAG